MKNTALKGYRYPYALVGFGGNKRFWWMHFFKKGFYHCLVALGNGHEWVLIDPLSHYTDIFVLKKVNLKGYLKSKGYRLIQTTPDVPMDSSMQIMPYTCVETVKRFIGVKNHFIFTPYQLFCYLLRKKENNP